MTRITGYREAGRAISGEVQMAPLTLPLVISFGDPFAIALGRAPSFNDRWASFSAGLFAGPVIIKSNGRAACVQIDFTPAGAKRFFEMPAGELSSQMVALDELGDGDLLHLRERLAAERDWSRRLALVEKFVVRRLKSSLEGHDLVQEAWSQIRAAGGNLRISALVKDLECSRKHLYQRFRSELGLSPKTIARMIRFNHALDIARRDAENDWADIAYTCGYADQAHLTREFAEFSGTTPSIWRAEAV